MEGATLASCFHALERQEYSLAADGALIESSVNLRNGFKAWGTVRLVRAHVAGNLDCVNASFKKEGGFALNCVGITVGGSALLTTQPSHDDPKQFSVVGEVDFSNAKIGGVFICDGAKFQNGGGIALSLFGAAIEHRLDLINLAPGLSGSIVLSGANVGVLVVDETSWPARGELFIQGLIYHEVLGPTFAAYGGCQPALEWLSHQHRNVRWLTLESQPWTQLASVLSAAGRTRDARDVLIDMNWRRTLGGIFTLFFHLVLTPLSALGNISSKRVGQAAYTGTQEESPSVLAAIRPRLARLASFVGGIIPLLALVLALFWADLGSTRYWEKVLWATVFTYTVRSVLLGDWSRKLADLVKNFFLYVAAFFAIFLWINQNPQEIELSFKIGLGLYAVGGIWLLIKRSVSRRLLAVVWLRELVDWGATLALLSGLLFILTPVIRRLPLPEFGFQGSWFPFGTIALAYGIGFLWSTMVAERGWLLRLFSLLVAVPTNIILGALIGWGFRPVLAAIWGVVFVIAGWFVFSTTYESGFMKAEPSAYDEKCNLVPGYEEFSPLAYSIDTLIPFVDLHQEAYWRPKDEIMECRRDEDGNLILDSDGNPVRETKRFPRPDITALTRADLLPPSMRYAVSRIFPDLETVNLNEETIEWLEDRFEGGWARKYLWFHIAVGYILATMAAAAITGIVKLKE